MNYLDINVYDAAQKRVEYIFEKFEQIIISFSGGKDSGIILNIVMEYAAKIGQLDKVGVYHMDYEAQYQMTTDYVTETFGNLPKEVKKYWFCIPVKAQCATSMHQNHWRPWLLKDKNIWVRNLPRESINENNFPYEWNYNIWDYDFNVKFAKELSKDKKTAFIIGIRSQESLNRFRTVTRANITRLDGKNWTVKVTDNLYNCYPIYDWETEDVWTANARFGWTYNKLYDLYYQAGLTIHQMRVASPFNDCAMDSLKLYKVIDPNNWGKMVGRVNGVNFSAIYGGTTAMGWKSITLPKGHTWESYMYFLLGTLPEETKAMYLEKLSTSVKFWEEKGGVLSSSTIQQLQDAGVKIKVGNKSNYNTDKKPVTMKYLDDAPIDDFKLIPSYKRMCICIMKNDHLCKYMGFSQTKNEKARREKIMNKYKNLL